MSLVVRRRENESWRDCVTRYAIAHGLEKEALEMFDASVDNGAEEVEAAFSALYEWDLLDYEEKT